MNEAKGNTPPDLGGLNLCKVRDGVRETLDGAWFTRLSNGSAEQRPIIKATDSTMQARFLPRSGDIHSIPIAADRPRASEKRRFAIKMGWGVKHARILLGQRRLLQLGPPGCSEFRRGEGMVASWH
ncbi:hypothetical protein BGZ61DRAFT_484024 [Ilyonectria robusta]|uniref:uncharacterized protein n=1 Tax=Ilyonectria robusta TaxID=1079257 RepID=UPI001E8E1077|nr:uncharacterized protein BGZ61DRAFT_484024 [Ilyonectria robusta]KAH8666085.1 hypothetical protein BGZ61DRAFT_484024 [Ilyonectria robusta]